MQTHPCHHLLVSTSGQFKQTETKFFRFPSPLQTQM